MRNFNLYAKFMSHADDLKGSISDIQEAFGHNQCPKKSDVNKLIDCVREFVRSFDAPSDESVAAELHRQAAISGMKVDKMTISELAYMIAEDMKKRGLRKKFAQKPKKGQ